MKEMKKEKSCKSDLLSAASVTVTAILMAIIIIRYEPKSDPMDIIMIALLVAVLSLAIYLWVKGLKRYIDFAVEEKINEKHERANSPNENVSDK